MLGGQILEVQNYDTLYVVKQGGTDGRQGTCTQCVDDAHGGVFSDLTEKRDGMGSNGHEGGAWFTKRPKSNLYACRHIQRATNKSLSEFALAFICRS